MIKLGRIDLNYLLEQVNILNDYTKLRSAIDPNGVREVRGSNNNLAGGFSVQPDGTLQWNGNNVHPEWGAADTPFLRLLFTDHPDPSQPAYGVTYDTVKKMGLPDANGEMPFIPDPNDPSAQIPNPNWTPTFTNDVMGSIVVADPGQSPRTISQLIASSDVDPTSPTYNPAAAEAMNALDGQPVNVSNSVVGVTQTAEMPNPGVLGGAPYNEWFVAFGQFFDHGLDFISKNGGYVLIPLSPSDPLYDPNATGPMANMMMLSRASLANPDSDFNNDGTLKAGVTPQFNNNTGLLIDQSQTYGSHESVNVLLRQYDANGVLTGRLVTNAEDGVGPENDLATWSDIKVNALRIGIELTDVDVLDAPLIKADAIGRVTFTPQNAVTFRSDESITEWESRTGLTYADYAQNDPFERDADGNVLRSNQPILIDIAHGASPVDHMGNPLAPASTTTDPNVPTYDDVALANHYVSGDGRVNENVGLTAVHHVFHEEHNIQAHNIQVAAIEDALRNNDLTGLNGNGDVDGWLATDITMQDLFTATGIDPSTATAADIDTFLANPAAVDAAIAALTWDGEKVYQAARIITESEYNHVAIDQFVGTLYPLLPEFVSYSTDIDMSVSLEFSQAVYRLGHSMLMEKLQIGIQDANGNNPGDPGYNPTFTEEGLFDAFLNPDMYAQYGPAAIAVGLMNQTGNQVDEFVTAGLQQSLVGVPLDLAALNIARGRDVGLPTLNEFRQQVFDGLTQNSSNNSNASGIAPYSSWEDFGGHLRNPASLVNFIAAYGREDDVFHLQSMRENYEKGFDAMGRAPNHPDFTQAVTLQDLRANAQVILDAAADSTHPLHDDAVMFMRGEGQPVYDPMNPNAVNGWVFSGGAGDQGFWDIDLWIGGLAEQPLFDGPLGTSFSFIMLDFAQRMQDGDRFYYLYRMPMGHHLGDQIIGEQFLDLVQRTTGLEHTGDAFGAPSATYILDGGQQNVADNQKTDVDANNNIHDYFNAIYENLPDSVKNFVVANNSFEIDSLADDGAGPIVEDATNGNWLQGTTSNLTGWVIKPPATGPVDGGLIAPTAAISDPSGHNGSNVAWLRNGTSLAQDTGHTIAEGATYTLKFKVGDRSDQDFAGGSAQLKTAGGIILGSAPLMTPDNDGGWAEMELSYTDDGTYAGETLVIEIVSGVGMNAQILIDDVSLTETTPGGSANDGHIVVAGLDGNDYIVAGLGDDVIYGDGGDDVIEGAQGNDVLYGGEGNDWITDYENDDFIHGGAGDDYLFAGPGVLDTVHGGDGDDEAHGGDGIDEVFGDDGDDRLYGEGDTDLLMGGLGNDYIDGGDSVDEAFGGDGNDWLRGGVGDDNLNGGAGNDLMEGGLGPVANDGDRMNGDWIGLNQVGANETAGNSGVPGDMDIVSYEEAGYGVTASLQTSNANGTVSNMLDTYALDEGLVGSGYDDILEGADANATTSNGPKNQLIGGAGNDRLTGLGDDDWLFGDAAVVRNDLWADIDATVDFLDNGVLDNTAAYSVITDWFATGEDRPVFTDTGEIGHILGDNGAQGDMDVAIYRGNRADYTITQDPTTGVVTVMDNRDPATTVDAATGVNSHDGTDHLLGIEFLEFADGTVSMVEALNQPPSVTGTAGAEVWTVGGGPVAIETGVMVTDPDTAMLQSATITLTNAQTGDVLAVDTMNAPLPGGITATVAGNVVTLSGAATPADYQTAIGLVTFNNTNTNATQTVSTQRVIEVVVNDGLVDSPVHTALVDIQGGASIPSQNWTWNVGDAPLNITLLDAQGPMDTVTINGDLTQAIEEKFEIFTLPFAQGEKGYTGNAEIVIYYENTLAAEISGVEEIVVNGGGGGDEFDVRGNFAPTSLAYNTITLNGGDGNDAVNISQLQSDHRIVFNGGNGQNIVLGPQRQQDVLNNAGYLTPAPQDQVVTGTDARDIIETGDGNDMVFGLAKKDIIMGHGGDDMLFGDAGRDRVFGGAGNDTIEGGAGRDRVFAGDGDDVILATVGDGNDAYHGGAGADTLDMSGVHADTTVELSSGLLGRGSAFSATSGNDTLWDIENVVTGNGNDVIVAGDGVNVMDGGDGDDIFVFGSAAAADGDVIADFQPGDTIDLSGIDADGSMPGDQAFTLVSGGFTGAMGELMVTHETRADGDYTVVEGQIDGAGAADFTISIKGHHDLTEGNFTL